MIHLITSQELMLDGIETHSDCSALLEYFGNKPQIGCDTETSALLPFDGKLLTLQLGDFENQWVVDAQTFNIIQLKKLLEDKLLLFHNAAFDFRWLYHNYINPKKIYDTFLVECVLTTGFENRKVGLKDVALKYLNVEVSKDDRGLIHKVGLSKEVVEYASRDVKFLSQIKDKQLIEVTKYNLQRVVDLENQAVRPVSLMEYHGISIDSKKWLEVADLTEQTVKNTIVKLDQRIVSLAEDNEDLLRFVNNQLNLFGFEEKLTYLNWNSNDQKKAVLHALGFNVENVADKQLQRLKLKHPIFNDLITLSKNQKLSTSFGREFLKFVNKNTNRIHGSQWQILHGARLAMSNPNLLQIPGHGEIGEKIRSCFIAKEGYLIVGTDVSGFELRLLAQFSQDPLWLKIFNEGKDLHSELCAKTFGIPMEDVKKPFPSKPDLTYRFVQKTINFGLSYGMSQFKLADVMQTTPQNAKRIIDQFFSVVPDLQKFLNMIAKTAVAYGQIRSDPYYKRIRFFPQLKKDDPFVEGEVSRAALNFPPQATNANLIKQCLINLLEEIESNKYDVKIVLTIHDEILTEVPEAFAEEWKGIQERVMKETIGTIITSIPVEVVTSIAKHWNH